MWYDYIGIRKWWCSFIAWLFFLQDKQYFLKCFRLLQVFVLIIDIPYFVTCNLVWHIVWIPAWSSHESLVILMRVAKELIDISWLAKKSIKLCLGQEYLWYLDDSPTGSSFSCVYIIVTTSCLTIKLIFHVFWCCVYSFVISPFHIYRR